MEEARALTWSAHVDPLLEGSDPAIEDTLVPARRGCLGAEAAVAVRDVLRRLRGD
jgi:hypothetical protein